MFYNYSKLQVDYMNIHHEYKFIKKRAMVTFLTNERLNLEKHFHDRTLGMLTNISNYEQQNMKNKLSQITQEALDATLKRVEQDEGKIKEEAFNCALEGLRKGRMDFQNDPIMPIMKEELFKRTSVLKGLTPEQESAMLSLTDDQRKAVAQMDRAARDTYLTTVPHVTSQGLKSQEKFLKFVKYLSGLNKRDIA
jgi:predicted enzyme related to lactoylglutathione lyase